MDTPSNKKYWHVLSGSHYEYTGKTNTSDYSITLYECRFIDGDEMGNIMWVSVAPLVEP